MYVVCAFIIALIIGFMVFTNTRRKENYEPQNMGSRRYWGWGRQYGYGLPEHGEDHGFCIPLMRRKYNWAWRGKCPAGYSKHMNPITGYEECCVNSRNYGRWMNWYW